VYSNRAHRIANGNVIWNINKYKKRMSSLGCL
jgi:hypothetical protein